MATQTLAAFDAVLKNVYRGPIVEQLNQETYLIDQLERQNVNDIGTFSGRQVIFPVHSARNRGRGSITDGGGLAVAGTQAYLDGIVAMRYHNTSIELTDMVIKQSETDEGAFVRALSSELEGATTDLRKDINRQVFGTGDGVLATVITGATSATIAVDSIQYIAVGDTIDVLVKSSGAVKGAGLVVTAVTSTGTAAGSTQGQGTITTGTSITVTTADGVYIAGSRNNESDGLRNITNITRSLHSIDSTTTNKFWDGNIKDAAYGTVSEDMLIQLAQNSRLRSSKKFDLFLGTLGVQRRLANTYTSQKRYNDAQATKLDTGYSAIMVAAGDQPIPFIADVDAPTGYVFGLNKGSFAWAELTKPDWLEAPDGKGSILTLKDASTAGQKVATWQAWLGWYACLVCVAPNRNGQVLKGADDNPVARL